MINIGKWITKHKNIILVIAFILLIPAGIGYVSTRVNYDVLSYLPESLETIKGQDILVDEYGMGAFSIGSSGLSLRSVPVWMMREFNEQRPYDLIILQYGLNVATERGRNYDKYIAGMQTTVQHLKEAFPQAAILIVSVGDRDYKTEEGELRTMPGIKNLVRYQQNLAADEAVAFWNMFEAMGGEGSMADMVHAKPSLANYDYTHINFRGGKHLAGLLYESLIYGKEQYDRRRAYYEEEP